MRGNSFLRKIWNGIYLIQSIVNAFLLMATVSIVVVQVFLRYVLRAPLMGIEEMLLFPAIWMYMLGGASASWERTHIECGVLTIYIKRPLTMKIFLCIKGLFSVGIGSWLLYWAYWYFSYGMRVQKTSAILHIPLVIAQSAIFIGLALMVFYAVVELLDYLLALFKSDVVEEKEGTVC
jgi:TRAP-type C4-dicarboxylate transport system permease small subunit